MHSVLRMMALCYKMMKTGEESLLLPVFPGGYRRPRRDGHGGHNVSTKFIISNRKFTIFSPKFIIFHVKFIIYDMKPLMFSMNIH